jgi:hypothetical protein
MDENDNGDFKDHFVMQGDAGMDENGYGDFDEHVVMGTASALLYLTKDMKRADKC